MFDDNKKIIVSQDKKTIIDDVTYVEISYKNGEEKFHILINDVNMGTYSTLEKARTVLRIACQSQIYGDLIMLPKDEEVEEFAKTYEL